MLGAHHIDRRRVSVVVSLVVRALTSLSIGKVLLGAALLWFAGALFASVDAAARAVGSRVETTARLRKHRLPGRRTLPR
jgi:hypothetical protein